MPLAVPIDGEEAAYLQECIDSTFVASVGPFFNRFETMVANASGAEGVVAVSAGATGLNGRRVATSVPNDMGGRLAELVGAVLGGRVRRLPFQRVRLAERDLVGRPVELTRGGVDHPVSGRPDRLQHVLGAEDARLNERAWRQVASGEGNKRSQMEHQTRCHSTR